MPLANCSKDEDKAQTANIVWKGFENLDWIVSPEFEVLEHALCIDVTKTVLLWQGSRRKEADPSTLLAMINISPS
jgi:hypothetical protein